MCTMKLIDPAAASAAASAFVAEHYDQIVKYGNRFFRCLPEGNLEDAIQALLLYCVEHHHQLRLEDARNPKAVISNWIYFQCVAVRKNTFSKVNHFEKAKKQTALFMLAGEETHSTMRIADTAAAELIDRLYDMATDEEKSAMIAVELELDAGASKKAGVPIKKQMELLRRLGQRAEAAGISVLY